MKSRPTVLLVESDAADEALTRRVIADSGLDCEVQIARDGAEACQMLFGSGDPSPTLVLLELAIPNMSGFDVLSRIRHCEETKRLPVVVFSSSGKQIDVDKCFDLHANSFVLKDKDRDLYETRLKLVLYYWVAVNHNEIA